MAFDFLDLIKGVLDVIEAHLLASDNKEQVSEEALGCVDLGGQGGPVVAHRP